MEPVIFNESKIFSLFGFSKTHDQNKPYNETMFELLDQVWQEVRNKGLSHKGINHVIYDRDQIIFAGIELISSPNEELVLEKRDIILQRYAYFKHIGPYRELGKTYEYIHSNFKAKGEQLEPPLLEVYGHWNENESLLETEIFHNLSCKSNII